MRVVLPIMAFYPDHGGGPSLSVYWMAKALAKKGVEVIVITSTRGLDNMFPINKWNHLDGFQVQYCSSKLRVIKESLRCSKNADIVHISSICNVPSVIIASLVGFFTKKPIIWSPRGELAASAINGNKLKEIVFRVYGKMFSKRVVFHGTSDKEIDEIRHFFPKGKSIQLPNYIELYPKLNNATERYMCFLGRINPIKSIDKLIKALSLSTIFMNSDFKFMIAGKDTTNGEVYKTKLDKLIMELDLNERVCFLGRLNTEQKNELLSKAYFSFLVSETENFGNAVVEAMAQGTPVVTSLGTPWSVLKDKGIGYHINNDPDSIAAVINELLSISPEKYHDLRQRVYDFCQEEYAIEKNIYKWIQIYSSFQKTSSVYC